jgi:hypothetical protein
MASAHEDQDSQFRMHVGNLNDMSDSAKWFGFMRLIRTNSYFVYIVFCSCVFGGGALAHAGFVAGDDSAFHDVMYVSTATLTPSKRAARATRNSPPCMENKFSLTEKFGDESQLTNDSLAKINDVVSLAPAIQQMAYTQVKMSKDTEMTVADMYRQMNDLMQKIQGVPSVDSRTAKKLIRDHLLDIIRGKAGGAFGSFITQAKALLGFLDGGKSPATSEAPKMRLALPLTSAVASLMDRMPSMRGVLKNFLVSYQVDVDSGDGKIGAQYTGTKPYHKFIAQMDTTGGTVTAAFEKCEQRLAVGLGPTPKCGYDRSVELSYSTQIMEMSDGRPATFDASAKRTITESGNAGATVRLGVKIPLPSGQLR